jgi:pimeloyl-ACP methyl ester carboxylesterase
MGEVADWTFAGAWPYEPCWFDTPDGRLHYIDEGPRGAPTVALVHGNPTWGFLYRDFIGPLLDAGFRVVVPDHLGFGRSDKPADPGVYRMEAHFSRTNALLESLDLGDVTLVPHDQGGPIAFNWAIREPQRASRLCILNTWCHVPAEGLSVPLPMRLVRTPGVGELLVKGAAMFTRGFLFRGGVLHPERLTNNVKAAYMAPHPTWASRSGILAFPREIPFDRSHRNARLLTELESGLRRHFRERPVKIIWAMGDPAFTPDYLDRWTQTFPEAEVVRLSDAGHYLQEDASDRIVSELLALLAGPPSWDDSAPRGSRPSR